MPKLTNDSGLVDETPCPGCGWPRSDCLCPEDDDDTCFACGTPLRPGNTENHHVLPTINNLTVPLCLSCHDLVDRFPLHKWPTPLYLEALASIKDLPRVPKLLALKFIAMDARTPHTPRVASP